MKKICMYMDEAQDIGAVKNDAELAKKLGISRASVSEWRAGKSTPNDDQAVKLAELLGKDAGELLAECGAARAKTPATRQAWERIAARMAISITLCVCAIHPSQSEASQGRDAYNLLFSELQKRRKNKGLAHKVRNMTECIKLLRYYVLQPIQGRFYNQFAALLGES